MATKAGSWLAGLSASLTASLAAGWHQAACIMKWRRWLAGWLASLAYGRHQCGVAEMALSGCSLRKHLGSGWQPVALAGWRGMAVVAMSSMALTSANQHHQWRRRNNQAEGCLPKLWLISVKTQLWLSNGWPPVSGWPCVSVCERSN